MKGCQLCMRMKPETELVQMCYMGQSTYECKSGCAGLSTFPALKGNTPLDSPPNQDNLVRDLVQYRDAVTRYTDTVTGAKYHFSRGEWTLVNNTEYDPSDMRVIKLKLFFNASFADLQLAKSQVFDDYIRYTYKGDIIKCHRLTADWSYN